MWLTFNEYLEVAEWIWWAKRFWAERGLLAWPIQFPEMCSGRNLRRTAVWQKWFESQIWKW